MTRAPFSAVSAPAGQTSTGRPAASERATRSVAAGRYDERRRRHDLVVGEPIDDRGVVGHQAPPVLAARVDRRQHPHGLGLERRERRADQLAAGVVDGARGDEDERVVSGRQLDVGVRQLEEHRPRDVRPGGPRARVLELGKGRDERESVAHRPVCGDGAVRVQRREAELRPRVAEQPGHAAKPAQRRPQGPKRRLDGPPRRRPERCARCHQPVGPRRQARTLDREEGRDQGRVRDPGDLGGERRRRGDEVRDDDVGAQLLDSRSQLAHDLDRGRLPRPVRRGAGKHVVARSDEAEAHRLGDLAPALRQLDGDVVAAPRELARQGERRKRVALAVARRDQCGDRLAHCASPSTSSAPRVAPSLARLHAAISRARTL